MAKDVKLIIGGDASGGVRALESLGASGKKLLANLNTLDLAQRRLDSSASSLSSSYGALSGILATVGAGKIASDMFQVNREFGKLRAGLVTVTGSTAAANEEFSRLQDFAARTPYQLNEVVAAATRLSALNMDASTEALESYGNTASAMGKSMIDMIEAVADASTGEFERLKEFGIKASADGDKIIFTFRGIKTEVANTADEITKYLLKIGQTEFAGGMKRQMDEIDGAASNLADTYDKLLTKTGKELPIKDGLQAASGALELLANNLDVAAVGMVAMTSGAVVTNLGTISGLFAKMAGSAALIGAAQAGLVGLVGAGSYMLAKEALSWGDDTFFGGNLGYGEKKTKDAQARADAARKAREKRDAATKGAMEFGPAALGEDTLNKMRQQEAKATEKRLQEIAKHNERIIDIEKKAATERLKLEEELLQKKTDAYKAAVDSYDSLVNARMDVKKQFSDLDPAQGKVATDPLNDYLDKQDELDRKEKEIASNFGMSAEDKAKAYADLAVEAKKYNESVTIDGQEVLSQFQAEEDYLERKKRLQEAANKLLDDEETKRFNAAVNAADQMNEATEKLSTYRAEIENLETILDRLNNKEINIIFKANGIGQIRDTLGYGVGGHTPGDGVGPMPGGGQDINAPFGSYFPGGGGGDHTPGDGVGPMPQPAAATTASNSMSISAPINVQISGGSGSAKSAQAIASEIARKVVPELNRLKPRFT
jgi:hypothetical protein